MFWCLTLFMFCIIYEPRIWLSFVLVFLWQPSAWWLSLMTFSDHNSLIPLLPECVEWLTYLTQNSFVMLLYRTCVFMNVNISTTYIVHRNFDGEVTWTLKFSLATPYSKIWIFDTFLLIKSVWWGYFCGRICVCFFFGKEI